MDQFSDLIIVWIVLYTQCMWFYRYSNKFYFGRAEKWEVQHSWIFQSRVQLICTKKLFVRLGQRAKVSTCPSPCRTIFGHARLGIKAKIKSPNRYSVKTNSIKTKSTKTKRTKVKRTKTLHKNTTILRTFSPTRTET